jgi:SAM-dependent methyltransferase
MIALEADELKRVFTGEGREENSSNSVETLAGTVAGDGMPPPFAEEKSSFKKMVQRFFPSASLTCFVDKTIFDYINAVSDEEVVLNLGSGVGRFDKYIKHNKQINLDIAPFPGMDLVADAHQLPLKSESIGCLYSNAVFEHLARPWIVAEEIYRVVKKNGIICINVPFLNIIHEAYDFYRYTPQGLREIFRRFEEIESGVSSGPSSFITYFLPEYISLFFPTSRVRSLVKDLATLLFSPLRYFDYLIKNRERYTFIATSFYFVGRKK